VSWGVTDASPSGISKLWQDLSEDEREALAGKLSGLWGAASDQEAFNACAVDKQETLLLMVSRLGGKGLWHVIRKIDNVYGEGGVGLSFSAWPLIESTLRARKDFTRLFANCKDTTGGFYEKGRADAVLHFLFVESAPRKWYVHFDLYSPVHSLASAFNHLRYEFIGKLTPDWRMIQQRLNA
jgi:hypothetical protein